MQKLILFTTFIFLFISKIFADELSEGYASFIKNDIQQAYQHFTAASQVPDTKAEAYLMLSLLSTVDKEQATSFNYFLEFYKSAPNPDPYIMALFHHKSILGYESLKTKEQLNWLLQLTKRTDLNSTLRAYLFEELGEYYEVVQDLKKSREELSQIGAIMEWQIVGDFENISASGFDKNYGPVYHPEPESIFKNKVDAVVKWFDLYKQVSGKWIDFTNNFYCNNTLVFAQTFCNSSSDQFVYLRIGTSGSLKLWVNDQLLFKESEERNNGIDTYIIPVKLFKGNNRILLQVACSKINRCNFMMRVTDEAGNILSNLPFSKVYEPYNKTIQDLPSPVASSAEEFFTNQINEHPEKLVNYLILANAFLSNDKIHSALEILQKARQIAPDCSFVLNQLSELYIRDKNRTSTSLTQEKLKLIDPDNPGVLNYIIDNDFYSENYKDARQYIEKKEQLYGENKDLLYYKLKLASVENKPEEYSALIDKSYTKYPNDYNFVYYKFQFEKDYKKNQKEAVKVLKDFSKDYFNKNALITLSDEYIQSGQVNESIEILKKLIEYFPFSDDYYKQLGMFYLQAGNHNAAKQYLEECLKIAPYYGPYHGNYAKVLEQIGEHDKAVNEYKLDITYKPDDYEAIKSLCGLQAKKEAFDYFPSKEYYKIFDNSPSASDYPSDNFISLTDESYVVLYKNGGCETRKVYMFKALTPKGIDNLKEYKIGYYSNEKLTIEKAEVLKKNGNRLQAEVKDNQIVYTSLEVGDAVFLIYKKSKNISSQMSKQFYEKSLLNTWYPSLNIEYNLLIAKDLNFDYKVDNSTVKPEITDEDDYKLYSWKKTFNKAIQLESYMPSMIDIGELLSISTLPDWDYISKWYFDISNTKTKTDVEVIETVNDLLKGKENLSQMQKVRIFYNFIEQNIHYSSVSFRQSGIVPQNASEVLITRIGDCKDLAVLFTSMCDVVGIKAGIVLVLRRQNGTNWINLPSFDFDHAIAKAILDGKEYYIELTSSYYPFATLGESLIKAVVLEVNNDTTMKTSPKVLSPSTRQPNNTYRETKVNFTGDNMTYTISTQRTGSMAAYTRSNYRDIGKEDREKKFTKSITSTYSNVKLLYLNFNSTLSDCSDTLSYSYSYSAPKVFTKINDLSILKLPLIEQLAPMDFLSLEERKYPIEAWKYSTCDTLLEKLIVDFPENKTLAEVPKSVHYSCNQADYSLTFNVQGNELKVIRRMVYKIDNVPVSDYSSYRSFIESVVNSDTQQIGFK
jgi:tetratricopeptide (TPR) repeat protein